MSFSCTIKAGSVDLTNFNEGPIHSQLFGLAPNTPGATDAPYRLNDLRAEVNQCLYGAKHPDAARDCFKELQRMARQNLESLKFRHCETCKCPDVDPSGWDRDAINRLLAIDPKTITFVEGGW